MNDILRDINYLTEQKLLIIKKYGNPGDKCKFTIYHTGDTLWTAKYEIKISGEYKTLIWSQDTTFDRTVRKLADNLRRFPL